MKYYKKEDFWFYNFNKKSFELCHQTSQGSKFYECLQNNWFFDVVDAKLLIRLRKLYVKNLL